MYRKDIDNIDDNFKMKKPFGCHDLYNNILGF